ncbi:MAG: MFS transporter, partial [Oscillospiraceae bacterium]|nr:MFS transporter [Oscillospiraceae bacterium]
EGVAANLLLGTLFVWSVLRDPLLELFPSWTEGMLSLIFGIHNLFTCIGILISGTLRKRFSARQNMVIFLIMTGIGLGGFALLPVKYPMVSYVMAFILFCGFAATGIGIGINTVQSTTIPWFPNNSGAISGALYMALGVSSVILAAIARKLLTVISVQFVLPVFGAVIVLVALLILMDKNSIQAPVASVTEAPSTGIPARKMLRSGTFIVLLIWNICLRTSGLILLDHAASMASFYGGLVLTAMLIAPANGMGSLSVGVTMDYLGLKRIVVIGAVLMTIAGGALCVGTLSQSYPVIFVGLLLGGFAYGGSSSSYAAAIKNSFGEKYYAQNFAVSNIAMGCAALLESTSGTVLDMFGSYSAVMTIVLILALIALLFALIGQKFLIPHLQ